MQLAEDMGIKVERRPIPEEELETFEEAGACGTAAVISPIQRIDDLENGKSYVISKDGKPGPICTKLYNKLRGIQYGDEPDTHGDNRRIIQISPQITRINTDYFFFLICVNPCNL